MTTSIPAYVEAGSKRTFAGAIDWPGWCRSARDEEGALAALLAYAQRYAKAVAAAAQSFVMPDSVSAFTVVQHLRGGSGTDFGVPSILPEPDAALLDGGQIERLIALLRAAWTAFDAAAGAAIGIELRKGPRGGGRDLDKMIVHVLEGERAYLGELGGKPPKATSLDPWADLAEVREAAVRLLRAREAGDEPAPGPRRTRPFWSPRYFVRRSAWHALDHAWEIEDRSR